MNTFLLKTLAAMGAIIAIAGLARIHLGHATNGVVGAVIPTIAATIAITCVVTVYICRNRPRR